MKPSGIIMIVAGLSLLISLPWILLGGLTLWVVAKGLYMVGVVLFIFNK